MSCASPDKSSKTTKSNLSQKQTQYNSFHSTTTSTRKQSSLSSIKTSTFGKICGQSFSKKAQTKKLTFHEFKTVSKTFSTKNAKKLLVSNRPRQNLTTVSESPENQTHRTKLIEFDFSQSFTARRNWKTFEHLKMAISNTKSISLTDLEQLSNSMSTILT